MESNSIASYHLEEIDTILSRFEKETGICSMKIDHQAECMDEPDPGWVCSAYYRGNHPECLKDHQLVLNESYRLGSVFTHLCHKDLVIWGIPLTRKREMVGGVLSGFRLFEQYRHREAEYVKEFGVQDSRNLYISSAAVRAYSYRLFKAMQSAKTYDFDLFDLLQRRAKIQSDIAEKLIERKGNGEHGQGVVYQKQEKLLQSIQYGETSQIRDNVHAVLSEIYIEAITNLGLLKFRMLELFVLTSRTILSVGGKVEDFYHLTNQFSKNTEELDDIYTFSLWLTDVLNDFIDAVIRKREKAGNINRALHLIRRNCGRKLTITEVCAAVAMSKSRFSEAFRQETGMSFSQYLLQHRVERAKKLMNEGNLTLSDIALQTGFYDQSHFTKTFKRLTGDAPSRYSARTRRRPVLKPGRELGSNLHT